MAVADGSVDESYPVHIVIDCENTIHHEGTKDTKGSKNYSELRELRVFVVIKDFSVIATALSQRT